MKKSYSENHTKLGVLFMMEWGDPDLQLYKEKLARRKKRDELRESQVQLNHRIAESFNSNSKPMDNKTVVHNHFNIIINITRDTTDEKITSLTERLTTIARRVSN
jgi:hypothetical protein